MKYKVYKYSAVNANLKMWLVRFNGDGEPTWSSKYSDGRLFDYKQDAKDYAYQYGGNIYDVDENLEKEMFN